MERLLGVFVDDYPAAMYAPDRYVLQVVTHASSPDRALRTVLTRWRACLMAVGLASFKLVRAEVMTPEELEAEAGSRPELNRVEWRDVAPPVQAPRSS